MIYPRTQGASIGALLVCCVIGIQSGVIAQKNASQNKDIARSINEVSSDSIKGYITRLVGFETRHSLSDTVSKERGIGAARRWVAHKLLQFRSQNNANMSVVLDPFVVEPGQSQRVPYPVTMKNVVATLHGSDPNDKRVILVSGHLDSRNSDVMDSVKAAPGANDDASGVAVVLELARILSRHKFSCTIIFMAVQGEEQGLLGARHMAAKMKNEDLEVIAMLNNDIVGNITASETGDTKENRVRIFSEMIPAQESEQEAKARAAMKSENDSPSRQLARYVKEVSEAYLQEFGATLNMRPDRFLRGGDHTPFSQNGFPAVRLCEYNENFEHQHQNIRHENGVSYGDLLEYVNFKYVANVTRVNLAAIYSLASAPDKPQDVIMKINLGNITKLSWSPPKYGTPCKGYNVLIRETYQPFWEKRIFVEGLTTEIPYSKDNYFFGVEAVGVNDLPSQTVIPTPVR